MYKLFLDDVREAPINGGFNVVRNYDECITILSVFRNNLEKVDLDYDLGTQKETGYDVLVYMKETGIYPKYINIHSDHPIMAREMVKYANAHFENSIISHKTYQKT